VLVLPVILLSGHGSQSDGAPPIAKATPGAPPPRMAVTVDPLAAGRALAARPATGRGVLDSTLGDVASHFDNSGGSGLVDGAAQPRFVGGKQITFAIPGGGERSEVLPLLPEYHEGHDLPTDTNTWQLVLQWHQRGGTGSPPVALEAGNGRLRLANVGTDQQDLGALGPNDTIDVVVHVHFSRDPATSVVDVWRDGVPKVVDYHPPHGTMIDAGDYLKLGLYRDPSIDQDSSMTTSRLVVGPTDPSINATGITPR
jgi:hypothetical protein